MKTSDNITSANGIEYSIYEGVGYENGRPATSDIAFIMLDDYDTPTQLVGWRYGISVGIDDDICRLIADFEEKNADLVSDIKNGVIKRL